MPQLEVKEYALDWRTKDNKGTVHLLLEDKQWIKIPCDSAQELAALAAILNESPVTYQTEDGYLHTQREPVGGTG